jgi:hypothetical protein
MKNKETLTFFFFISNTSNHTFLTTYLFHFSLPSPPFLTYHTQIRFLSLNSFPAPSPRSRPPVFERCTDCLPTLIITIIIIIKKTKNKFDKKLYRNRILRDTIIYITWSEKQLKHTQKKKKIQPSHFKSKKSRR